MNTIRSKWSSNASTCVMITAIEVNVARINVKQGELLDSGRCGLSKDIIKLELPSVKKLARARDRPLTKVELAKIRGQIAKT